MYEMKTVQRTSKPWGTFEQYTLNQNSTVKVITVSPGSRLSLQRHRKREELWVVLDEGLEAEIEGEVQVPRRGERVLVPQGSAHRLANPSTSEVRVLEISFGNFDEDDIERLEDDYGRRV